MSRVLGHLLETLPRADDRDALVVVTGYVVRGPAGYVRLLCGDLAVDLPTADVVESEELGSDVHYAVRARLVVRAGTLARTVGSSEPFRGLIGEDRVPFAVLTRASMQGSIPSRKQRYERFAAAERRFLARYGLDPAGGSR